MTLFLRNIILFLSPVLLLGITGELLLRNIPNDYKVKKVYLDANAGKIKVLFLGNSHAFYGIDPQYFTEESFNAAYISQSLYYDWVILKKYSNKLDQLKYIVIPVDYFSLFTQLNDGNESWRVKNYNIYYGFHASSLIKDHSEMLGNKLNINILRLYRYYYRHQDNVTCSQLGWGKAYQSQYAHDLIKSAKIAAQRHRASSDKHFNENVAMLKSILDFAKSRQIKVLLFTSPAYKTYSSLLDPIQLNTTITAVTRLSGQYSNAIYINFLTDSSFTKRDFFDADHLDELGAKKFSIKLDSIIHSRS